MRSWKAQRRLQNLRGRRPWPFYLLMVLGFILAGVSALFALASCVPTGFQVQSMVLTWFFAALGVVVGIILYVLGERQANKLLLIDLIAMAVSLVAAIVW